MVMVSLKFKEGPGLNFQCFAFYNQERRGENGVMFYIKKTLLVKI